MFESIARALPQSNSQAAEPNVGITLDDSTVKLKGGCC
jgi:hypothetical protein